MSGTKGRSGRNPKPLAMLRAEGDRGHRGPKLKRMIEPEAKGSPKCPTHLTDIERAIWQHVIANAPADVLNRCDDLLLEVLAVNLSRMRLANSTVEKTGLVVKGPQGATVNPLVRVANACAAVVRNICSDLGLSPVARARLIRLDDFDDHDDVFESYIFADAPDTGLYGSAGSSRSKHPRNGVQLN